MTGTWPKRIVVDKDIVTLLSKRTYNSFPQALREMVSNAYDADATLVEIEIDPGRDQISIADNGSGMTPEDFEYYLRIAAMTREARSTSRLGRRRIGYFGIGFLSIFPFCCSIQITSSTANSDRVFTAQIDADAYTRPAASRVEVQEIEIRGSEGRDQSIRRWHGTRFVLRGLKDLVTQYFDVRPEASRKSVLSWEWEDRLRWDLQQILPLPYPADSQLSPVFAEDAPACLEVRLNGRRLYRNTITAAEVLESVSEPMLVDGVRFTYAIVTPRTTISPTEARGLQLRLRNVGVGPPTYFGLNTIGKVYGKLVWLGGEVHILEGLDDDISINRDSFSWSPRYEALGDFFIERLASLAERVDREHAAARDIEDFLQGEMLRAPIATKREAIENRIARLENDGYEIVRTDISVERTEAPVEIDTGNRVLTYRVNHPDLRDRIRVAGREYDVGFASWRCAGSGNPACRWDGDTVIFNREYPLFRNWHTKEVGQKLVLLLEIGRRRGLSTGDLCEYILTRLPEEVNIY